MVQGVDDEWSDFINLSDESTAPNQTTDRSFPLPPDTTPDFLDVSLPVNVNTHRGTARQMNLSEIQQPFGANSTNTGSTHVPAGFETLNQRVDQLSQMMASAVAYQQVVHAQTRNPKS